MLEDEVERKENKERRSKKEERAHAYILLKSVRVLDFFEFVMPSTEIFVVPSRCTVTVGAPSRAGKVVSL